jgi:phosphatidylglycerophosphate synthase
LFPFLRLTYSRSLKSARSDEWINTYAIRPAASILVWLFHRAGLRPIQVVLLGTATGLLAGAAILLVPEGRGLTAAGLLILLKTLLDAADGQLARATGTVDRLGRFADAVSDFFVNAAVTLPLGAVLAPRLGPAAWFLAGATFAVLVLGCSLFVFYQVSHLERSGRSPANRPDERAPRPGASAAEARLHRAYLLLYGWQDRMMAALDRALLSAGSRSGPGSAVRGGSSSRAAGNRDGAAPQGWYDDPLALRLTSFLGLGTSLTGYAALLVAREPLLACAWVVVLEPVIALAAILYRLALARRLRRPS